MRKLLGIGATVAGIGIIVFWSVLWWSRHETGRFQCNRGDAHCTLHSSGTSSEIPRASIQRVHVSHSRSAGDSLVLVTAASTTVLGGHTMHGDSEREYEHGAGEISAFLEGRSTSVDVTYTQRIGLAQLLIGVVFGALIALAGLFAWRRAKAAKV